MRKTNTDPDPRKGFFLKPTSHTENTTSNSSEATHTSIKYKLELCAYRSQYLTIFTVFAYSGKHQIDAERNPEPKNSRISS